MTKRPVINSKSLRQQFPKYYKELFSTCQIVFSADDSFFWAGEYARFFGGLTIIQKIPAKTLVGLELLDEKRFCFAENLYGYDPTEKDFVTIPFDYVKEIRLINFLREYWPTLDPKGKIKGFKIHILSGSHCGGGLGSTGVVFACLAACLLTLSGQINANEFTAWEKATIEDLMANENFIKTFRLAWRLTAISRDGNSSGAVTFGAMVSSSYPILFISQNINKFLDHPSIASPENNLDNCKVIEEIPFWGHKMEEIFPLRVPQPWPIDIARVYSGALINTENIFKSLSRLKLDMEELGDTINRELAPNIHSPHSQGISVKYLFDLDSKEKYRRDFCFWDYLRILNSNAIKLLLALKDLFLLGPHEENLRKFTTIFNQVEDFNKFMGHSTPLLDKICNRLADTLAAENEYHISGVKIEGIGKGGHVLAVGPQGMITDKVNDEIKKLSTETGKNINVDWASWIDGFGHDGLVLEQYLDKGIYSNFVSTKSKRAKIIENNQIQTKIVNDDKEINFENYDLVLSCSDNKIYSKGQLLSSKYILSARSTIELMKKLIESPEGKIYNKQFKNSSYGQNRYDLQSKIFIPLDKSLQKIVDKPLEFKITGGVSDDFSVSLNFSNLSILLLENVY